MENENETKTELDKAGRVENMLIPDYILNFEGTPSSEISVAPNPVLVFVNSKSGGQLGSQILPIFRGLLNPKQVHELPIAKPEEVLRDFLGHLEKLIEEGDKNAEEVRDRLRVIVAGGDGTHGWLLGAVADMKLEILPPVATIPLGTGNNLPFSFGWGKKNPLPTVASMREILKKTVEATPITCDRWGVIIRMSIPVDDGPLKKLASNRKPSLKNRNVLQVPSFRNVDTSSEQFESGRHSYAGGFWNYLSIGMDSQVAYAFHSARQAHPEKFKNQLTNQSRYATLALSQGWFCASCMHPRSKNVNTLANVYVAKYGDEWTKLDISPSIRSILMLNLPSFSGGLNPWGDPGTSKAAERGLTAPYVNDGLIEIVGFRDAWHGLVLLAPRSHGTRLAQAHKVKIEFHKGGGPKGVDHTYMRVDGEPWLQNLPSTEDSPTIMEISHKGQAVVLTTGEHSSKTLPAGEHRPISTASFHSVQWDVSSSKHLRSIGEGRNGQEKQSVSEPSPSGN